MGLFIGSRIVFNKIRFWVKKGVQNQVLYEIRFWAKKGTIGKVQISQSEEPPEKK